MLPIIDFLSAPSKELISKVNPSVNIEELLNSGFTKSHVDYALALSKDKTEDGLINWMLDNPEEKVVENIKAGRITDPFAKPALPPLKKNPFVDNSVDVGNLFGNVFEEEKKEEKKLPELDKNLNFIGLLKTIHDKNSKSVLWKQVVHTQSLYKPSAHSGQTLQLIKMMNEIKNETRHADYTINIEGLNHVFARILEGDATFLNFVNNDISTQFKRLRRRIYESFNNIFHAYFNTRGQFGDILESQLFLAFNFVNNSNILTPRQISRLLQQYNRYTASKKLYQSNHIKPQASTLFLPKNPEPGLLLEPVKGLQRNISAEKKTDKGFTEYESCIVCMDNLRNYVYFPCKHLLTCTKCVGLFKNCPVCQSLITEKVKVLWGAEPKAK